MRLDALDIRILNALQADNRVTAEALARTLPLSPSAITRRLQRLRAGGVIAAEAAVLSETVTAGRISALILVQLERHTPEGFPAAAARADAARRGAVERRDQRRV